MFAFDGPLSLQDSLNGSIQMMDVDTGQSDSPSKSPYETSANQRTGSHSPANAVSTDSAHMMNGDLNIDELANVKNLKESELGTRTKEIVKVLAGLDTYENGLGMKLVKALGDTYWGYRPHRKKIGDGMAEAGFGEVAMKMLKTLNAKGIFKNDSIWFPAYYSLNTLWNFTDASLRLAKAVAEADGVRFFTANCSHQPFLTNLNNKNVYYIVKSSMSIIHNVARNPDVIHFFKECKTTDVMLKFLKSYEEHEMLKIMAMLTLAHIVEEEENDKLMDDTGSIEGTISYIDKAIESDRRRYRGFTPQELMDGLGKLAVNDNNKKKIVEAGALPIFMKMLKSESVEEHAVTARALWTLSFDKDVCQQIVEYPDMMTSIEKLRESSDSDVRKNVNGALFVLKGENDVSKRPRSGKKNKGHVFISYSWNEKDIVLKIRERLKAEGLDVWIDIERMGGSTLTAMADAVENAAVVLVCMSEKYKQSPNCRLEAEYTFQLRKDYIPLMMQMKYRPDGWLGAILGAKLYFDFSGKYPFEKPWNGLVKELKGMGRLSLPSATPGKEMTDGPILATSASTVASSPGSLSTSSQAYRMTSEEVSNWLCQIKLDGCVPSLAQFDGKLLVQLQRMKLEAPEFYYASLEKKLNMNLVEILTFTEALDKL
ncbi:uncharacterized protein LOC117314961 isoform X1 [Pecten maximus]|uniref:uncharacterized protein LOC117314961 isoform X1 n=2 Tax=Pecten maximus TaxID=6579 RepID=UPI0014582F8A|nr:uncharacterized protein LOC117314961 isoform X1 [Pecten maximus]